MYIVTLLLNPPISTLRIAAIDAKTSTPRRLHRSARTPEGTSSTGTTTAYTAAMTPTEAGLNPIVVMNSFSMGTHRARFWRKTAAYSGPRRRLSSCLSGLVEVAGVVANSPPQPSRRPDATRWRNSSDPRVPRGGLRRWRRGGPG